MQKNDHSKQKYSWKHIFEVLWFLIRLSFISFGGGNAMMPIAYQQAVEKYKWMTKNEFDETVVMVNLLPGPSSLQMLSYIAIKKLGRWLGFTVTLVAFLPHMIFGLILLYFVRFLPPRYLLVTNLGIITTIIGVLLGFSIQYFRNSYKSLSLPLYISVLISTFVYCFFIPSPYNLSIIPILVIVVIYTILYHIRKKKVS
ncbi:chromate transporter [Mesomycoplasma conjunctivae]|uniref:Chromate transport protein, putative n=1 Tax=Mesomycoplasma conjunctivae (strain ATCC 25834 / NCTC 10147 / HRC/581) TaxID=572263 RepID=C5J6R6_MESCH|nr:chromate transporter [Mesomycoplasma conjunctivae]CAT05178.1 Chromate transport protein, putative [Mesomycoplasma conjunctivae]VEU66184.1 chromate transporter [Mesomycoplasma conjunctivae]